MKVLSLLIMAAGMGSRYGGLKQFDTFGPSNCTLLEYAVQDAMNAGFQKVVFVIKPEMEMHFRQELEARLPAGLAITYVHQTLHSYIPEGSTPPPKRLAPWGTAHAVLVAKEHILGPFVAINADDYYGPLAFQKAAHFLQNNSNDHALVVYPLEQTLSPHGSVSRGICTLSPENYLQAVEEHTHIESNKGSFVSYKGTKTLTGKELVSMNFWIFQPTFFATLEEQFHTFLKEQGADLLAEFYLPAAVSSLINQKRATVHALTSTDRWCGVTYTEDRGWVEEILSKTSTFNN